MLTAPPRGPTPGARLLSGVEEHPMPTQYLVRYAILPPGTGPDDYESADLVHREETFELSDPEQAGEVAGQNLRYGPHRGEVQAAVRKRLAEGEEPIILSVRLP